MTIHTESKMIKGMKAIGIGGAISVAALSFQIYKSGFNTYEAMSTQLAKQIIINQNTQQQISDLKLNHTVDIDKVEEEIKEIKSNIDNNNIIADNKIK